MQGRHKLRRIPNLQDSLSALTDRTDLEKLFDRKVGMSGILRIAGMGIRRETILALLESPDPPRELEKLLNS
jgi:hypothetical protein